MFLFRVLKNKNTFTATNEEDALNMEEFLLFGKKDESDLENSTDIMEEKAAEKEATLLKLLQEIRKEYNIPPEKINCFNANSGIEKLSQYCDKYESDIQSVLGNIKEFFEKEVKLCNEKEIVNSKIDYGGTLNEKGFIEPDIDDFINEPAQKKIKVEDYNEVVVSSNAFSMSTSKKQ